MIRVALSALTLVLAAGAQDHPVDREAALGARLAATMRQQTREVKSPVVQKYVADLGDRLRSSTPDPNQTFTFTVVTDALGGSLHEPFLLPGGHVFVPTALILEARDESELAGMLAHSMAHLADSHAPRQVINYGTVPLVFVGGWTTDGAALPTKFLKVRQDAELQADREAVLAMHAAGYDPNVFLTYIDRVQRALRAGLTTALPDRETRLAALRAAISPLSPVKSVDHPEFSRVRAEVEGETKIPPPTLYRPGEK
jgi:predicted Zn-dependent protease